MHLHRDSHSSNEYGQKKPLAMVFPNIYSLWHTININTSSPIGTTIWYVCVQSGIFQLRIESRTNVITTIALNWLNTHRIRQSDHYGAICDLNNSKKRTSSSSSHCFWEIQANATRSIQYKNHNLQFLDHFTFRVSLYLIIAAASLSNHIGVFFLNSHSSLTHFGGSTFLLMQQRSAQLKRFIEISQRISWKVIEFGSKKI